MVFDSWQIQLDLDLKGRKRRGKKDGFSIGQPRDRLGRVDRVDPIPNIDDFPDEASDDRSRNLCHKPRCLDTLPCRIHPQAILMILSLN